MIISFYTPKGGAGKSTLSLAFACLIAESEEIDVAIIDTDVNLPVFTWFYNKVNSMGLSIDDRIKFENGGSLKVYRGIDSDGDDLVDALDHERKLGTNLVIIDTEGIASKLNSMVLQLSDFIMIPAMQDMLYLREANKTINDIDRINRNRRTPLNYAIVFTNCDAAIQTNEGKALFQQAIDNGWNVFKTAIMRRQAVYPVQFSQGKTINELARDPSSKKSAEKAIDNISSWIEEFAQIIERYKNEQGS